MSKVGVIVALLVAIVLGGVALLVMSKGKPAQDAGGALLDFDPADAVEFRVSRADGSFEAVRRGGGSADWSVVVAGPGGTESGTWPAAGEQVRPALRILSTLSFE